jgi:hypothetical protein
MVRFLFVSLTAIFLSITPSHAETRSFEGKWRQIASTAGDCSTCAIAITTKGTSLSIKANNGWTASVKNPSGEAPNATAGNGQWSNGSGYLAGRTFQAHFEIAGSRLFMKMLVRRDNGTVLDIKAIFERSAERSA